MTTRTILLAIVVTLAIWFVASLASAFDIRKHPEPLCIACQKCECEGDCLCPREAQRYELKDDWWVMVYEPEHDAYTIAEMVAGTIRWSGSAWGAP